MGYRILETGKKDGVEVISEATMADKFPELLKEYVNQKTHWILRRKYKKLNLEHITMKRYTIKDKQKNLNEALKKYIYIYITFKRMTD